MKILVLGAGLVGGPMAVDLAATPEFDVTVADSNEAALARLAVHPALSTVHCDVRDQRTLGILLARTDMVVSAVPGFLGFETLRAILQAGKNVVDIAFFPEDPFELDSLATHKGVTALVDCGVCPGMTSVLVGRAETLFDEIEDALICVGGLPQVRQWPYEYKAVFSPVDVIEEYTRPARFIENGRLVTRPALSDPEYMTFPGVGTLEAFNTDGLRTLLKTVRARSMKEKTLRYPGHIEKMAVLRDTGFFGKEEIEVSGVRVRPLDVTAQLLFPQWAMGEGEGDITVLRVTVTGVKNGTSGTLRYDLVDRYDPVTRTLSMARTTGYTATSAVRMLAAGLFRHTGIIAPEMIGRSAASVSFLLRELAARGVVYQETRSGGAL